MPSGSESTSFVITVNGQPRRVEGAATTLSLLEWLRRSGLTGTKMGCNEGDCGACTVALVDEDIHGKPTFRAVNACIAFVPAFAGRSIVTVEGLVEPYAGGAPTLGDLHPVQAAMVRHHGSQCGFCTPGFIGSMLECFHRDDLPTDPAGLAAAIGDQLSGNLCRCTGYRPIREAMMEARNLRREVTGRQYLRVLGDAPELVKPLDYVNQDARFVRPTRLDALLVLLAAHPEAELVAGATELGVYVNKRNRTYPTLIATDGVRELTVVERRNDALIVGGAATLTRLEEALGDDLPLLKKMLWVFASRQIRNRATLAGNLVTASPIGDMAPVLLSLDAKLHLSRWHGGSRVDRVVDIDSFVTGYRKTVLAKGEIVRAVEIPLAGPEGTLKRHADSFKVSKRRELDISIVAASFVVDVDDANIVRRARLAFGGVAATPARAKELEDAWVGKPFDRSTVSSMSPLAAHQFAPISDVRSGAPFRAGLIVSLLDKLVSGEKSEAQDLPLGFEAAPPSEPAVASPIDTTGKVLPHESGVGHVTGNVRYVDDQSRDRPMLEVWPIMSKVTRGRVRSIDANAARAMPGVHAVLLASDIPGMNDVGAIRHDEPLFAADEVSFRGQMLGVVVAESWGQARNAAEAVKVDIEPLPAVLGVDAAMAAQSFHTEPHVIRRGDVTSVMAAAPHRLSGRFDIGGQEHFYLETHAAWAERGDDGDLFVASSTQHPAEIQAVISHLLDIPRNRVVVQSPRMGGAFGGKETQGNGFAAIVALAAWKLGRPVRLMLDRDVDIELTGKRHPFRADYEVGFDDDGRILALSASLVSDGGYALDLSESILDRALFHIDNCYYLPNVDLQGRVAKTNVVSHTAFRGFGGPQGMLVIEEIADRIARTLGKRPEDVRAQNLYGEGRDEAPYGQRVEDNRIPGIFRVLRERATLDARRLEIAQWNDAHPNVKRGIAMTPVKFGISFTASHLNQAGALVMLYRDGTCQVNHGGTEMGQGLHTKMLGVAMRELGLAASSVRVMKTQTDKVPNTSATAASSGADLNGAAVRNACEQLRERLLPIAAELLTKVRNATSAVEDVHFVDGYAVCRDDVSVRVPMAQVTEAAYVRQVSMAATGYYRTPGIGYDKKAGRGKPFHYYAFGAAVAEVEVDGLSGMKRIRRVDILHDVGDSLHPNIDRGQIEGAFLQGAGWLTAEELKWNAEGALLSHSASTYAIPSIGDAPPIIHVDLLPDAPQRNVIHGSKAVGEPPLMLAISVREAIRDAIAAFGGTGPVDLPSPATHEAIWHAVRARRGHEA